MSERIPGVSDDVERRILALAHDTRRQTPIRRRVAIAAVVVVVVSLVMVVRPRPDLALLPIVPLALTTAAALAGAAFTLRASASTRRSTGPKLQLLLALAIASAPLYALLTAVSPLRARGAPAPVGTFAQCLASAWSCFGVMMMMAGAGLAALLVAFRHAVPVSPRARGAAFGAAAGAWGGLAIHLRCPSSDTVHILAGHALPIALMAAVGAVVAPFIVRP
ncbi:MAG: DUF1109 family protein [Deltaproteobacteria bacterium]|nr:DUF1109 family protein [Deltaproteobacteria bacterium]